MATGGSTMAAMGRPTLARSWFDSDTSSALRASTSGLAVLSMSTPMPSTPNPAMARSRRRSVPVSMWVGRYQPTTRMPRPWARPMICRSSASSSTSSPRLKRDVWM